MKRTTSEKAEQMIGNKFDMILIAAARTKELKRGDQPKLVTDGGPISTSLLEIEEGLIGREYLRKIK